MVSAFESGEIHTNFETSADYVSILDALDLVKSEVVTASTVVARTNVANKPYDDQKVRQALQLAVDNTIVLAARLRQCRRARREPPCLPNPSGICRTSEDQPRHREGQGPDD